MNLINGNNDTCLNTILERTAQIETIFDIVQKVFVASKYNDSSAHDYIEKIGILTDDLKNTVNTIDKNNTAMLFDTMDEIVFIAIQCFLLSTEEIKNLYIENLELAKKNKDIVCLNKNTVE